MYCIFVCHGGRRDEPKHPPINTTTLVETSSIFQFAKNYPAELLLHDDDDGNGKVRTFFFRWSHYPTLSARYHRLFMLEIKELSMRSISFESSSEFLSCCSSFYRNHGRVVKCNQVVVFWELVLHLCPRGVQNFGPSFHISGFFKLFVHHSVAFENNPRAFLALTIWMFKFSYFLSRILLILDSSMYLPRSCTELDSVWVCSFASTSQWNNV